MGKYSDLHFFVDLQPLTLCSVDGLIMTFNEPLMTMPNEESLEKSGFLKW